MFSELGVSTQLSLEDVDTKVLADSKILLVEGYILASASSHRLAKTAAEIAHQVQHQIAFTLSDPGFVSAFQSKIHEYVLNEVDILFGNEEEYWALFPNVARNEIFAHMQHLPKRPELVVMTMGPKGSKVLLKDNRVVEFKASKPSTLLDTRGAGDMFASGFLYGLLHGQSIEQAGQLASDSAAIVIAQHGGQMLDTSSMKDASASR